MRDFLRKLTGGGSDKGKDGEKSGRRRRRREEPPPDPRQEETRRLHRQLDDNAQTMSLRRLKSYGLQAVRVIDATAVQQIVAQTVDEALRLRGVQLTPTERLEVHDMAKAQLIELTQQNQELNEAKLAEERQRHVLEEQLAALRGELTRRQGELEEERQRLILQLNQSREAGAGEGVTRWGQAARDPESEERRVRAPRSAPRDRGEGEDGTPAAPRPAGGSVQVQFTEGTFQDLEVRVGNLIQRLLLQGELSGQLTPEQLANLEKELANTVGRAVGEVRKAEGGGEGGTIGGEKLALLERRITKLNQALAEKEDALKRLAALKSVDAGLASIYDGVQGLTLEDPDYERKTELLGEIFQQNVELQAFMAQQEREKGPRAPSEAAPLEDGEAEASAPLPVEELQIPDGFATPVDDPIIDEAAF